MQEIQKARLTTGRSNYRIKKQYSYDFADWQGTQASPSLYIDGSANGKLNDICNEELFDVSPVKICLHLYTGSKETLLGPMACHFGSYFVSLSKWINFMTQKREMPCQSLPSILHTYSKPTILLTIQIRHTKRPLQSSCKYLECTNRTSMGRHWMPHKPLCVYTKLSENLSSEMLSRWQHSTVMRYIK
nr:BPK_HP1_G0042860.mRNA.1.CDS.1 [Saccharomyces cerevisiae]